MQDIRDRFSGLKMSMQHPCRKAWVVVPSDDADVENYARCLRIEGDGVIRLRLREMAPDETIDIQVKDGEMLHMAARRIYSTGTTVAKVIAFE